MIILDYPKGPNLIMKVEYFKTLLEGDLSMEVWSSTVGFVNGRGQCIDRGSLWRWVNAGTDSSLEIQEKSAAIPAAFSF